jgi:predicted dehydrogenase
LGAAELAKVQKTFGIEQAFEDFRKMLAAVPMDGVVVSSPHTLHFEHASAALENGCHVLIEKPLTTAAGDARALVKLADAKGRSIVVPYGWNFKAWVNDARRLVKDVGKIEHVVLQMANALDDLFAGRPMLETEGAMFRPPASTWADPKAAGGFGGGQLVHPLGLLFQIADLKPQSVFAVTGKSPAAVDYYDAAVVRFEAARRRPSRRGNAAKGPAGANRHPHFRQRGHAAARHRTERLGLRRRDGKDEVIMLKPGDGGYECAEPLRVFVDLCLGRATQNPASGVVGQRAVEVLDAVYRSAESGRMEAV